MGSAVCVRWKKMMMMKKRNPNPPWRWLGRMLLMVGDGAGGDGVVFGGVCVGGAMLGGRRPDLLVVLL